MTGNKHSVKGLAVFLALTIACGLAFLAFWPRSIQDSGSCGASVFWTLYENGTLRISGQGAMEDYGWSYAQGASAPWWKHNGKIRSVQIDSGVTEIGAYAFCYQSRLKHVAISDTVTGIGRSAFWACSHLTDVGLPRGTTTIQDGAFSGCRRLTSLAVPDSVTHIGAGAFCGSGLKAIEFSGSAPQIAAGAFAGVAATARYPEGDASWTQSILQNYGGELRWILSDNTKEQMAAIEGSFPKKRAGAREAALVRDNFQVCGFEKKWAYCKTWFLQ